MLLGGNLTVSASRGGGRLPISLMQPGAFQPRREIHQQPLLPKLAASIKTSGVIQPIVVRTLPAGGDGDAKYEIVAGERRWRAAKWARGPRRYTDHRSAAVRQRSRGDRADRKYPAQELTPAEEARALQHLIGEFDLTHQDVATAVGRSRVAVTNLIDFSICRPR